MYNPQNVATTIKKLLLGKGVTAKEMCADCSLGVNTLSNIRRGDVKNIETFQIIADYLDVSLDTLLDRDQHRKEQIAAYGGSNVIKLPSDISNDDLKLIEFILSKYN